MNASRTAVQEHPVEPAGRATALPVTWRRALVPAAVAGVLAASIVLRFATRSDLWLDEAVSVNIARLPLSELRGALRVDGAPPLYYFLLHFWIRVFGEGDLAVRSMSGVVSVATLPAAYLAGRRVGGSRVGWFAVLLLAASPYAIRYATEARMYALIMFLVLWGYLVVRRALEQPSFARLAVVTVIAALLLYTQYWSWYLIIVVGGIVIVAAWRASSIESRRAARAVAIALAIGAIAYVPWLTTLSYQIGHTGTPWGEAVVPWSAMTAAFASFVGVGTPQHAEAYWLLVPIVALPLLALFGRALDGHRIELDLRTRPAVRWEVVVAFGTLVLGLVASYVGGVAFDGRYASVMFPLLILVSAFGITAFGSSERRTTARRVSRRAVSRGPRRRRLRRPPEQEPEIARATERAGAPAPRAEGSVRVGVVTFVVALGLLGGFRNFDDNRTQAHQVADVIRADAHPGDMVVYCPDQLGPAADRLLRHDHRLAQQTFPDRRRPGRIDWVDYADRVNAADPAKFASAVFREAGNHTIWYVTSPGYHNLDGKCEAVERALAGARPRSQTRVVADPLTFFESEGLIEYDAG